MTFVDFVVEVHGALAAAELPHAFGGALALAYVAEPRGTTDIDVNVFSPLDGIDAVLDVFAGIGLRPTEPRDRWIPIAGIRLRRDSGPYPVDLFPSLDERYGEIAARTQRHPFGPAQARLPFLSPEDLCVFKLSFGREKDWVDLRSIAALQTDLDTEYVERQLVGLPHGRHLPGGARGPAVYPRMSRFRKLLGAPHG